MKGRGGGREEDFGPPLKCAQTCPLSTFYQFLKTTTKEKRYAESLAQEMGKDRHQLQLVTSWFWGIFAVCPIPYCEAHSLGPLAPPTCYLLLLLAQPLSSSPPPPRQTLPYMENLLKNAMCRCAEICSSPFSKPID